MKISIAMATFNGAKYLIEQLNSFKHQTRLPEELVICDDCSTDATIQILEDFSRDVNFTVKIYRNSEQLGFIKNFSKAISLCSGDLIFLSDQDDFWFPQKIQRIEHEFLLHPTVSVVVNDAELSDEYLNPRGLTVAGQLMSSGQTTDSLELGCCIAFKALLVPIILPVPEFHIGHDTWINRLGIDFKTRSVVLDVLQYYRRHDSNVTVGMDNVMMKTRRIGRWEGIKRRYSKGEIRVNPVHACDKRMTLLRDYKERIAADTMYFKNHLEPIGFRILSSVLNDMDAEINANEKRKCILKKNKLVRLFRVPHFYIIGGYKYFQGWKSFLKDIFY